MTDPRQQQTPPAWYPDPDPNNPGGQRWWDGMRWTEHFRPAVHGGQPLYDAPASAQVPQPGQPETPVQSGPVQPGAVQPGAPQPAYAQQVYAPTQGQPAAYPRVSPGTSALTWSIWLIVGLPLLPMIAYMFLDFDSYFRAVLSFSQSGATPDGADLSRFTSSLSSFIVGTLLIDALGIVIYGLCAMFAYFDWRELGRRGFARPFHWAWCFLGPVVYVIGRAVVTHRRGGKDGMWPIWAIIAVFVITIVLVVVKVVMIFGTVSTLMNGYGVTS